MLTIGYAQLISRLSLTVRPLAKPAQISGSVNRRVDSADRVLFPRGVAIADTLVGHLEFALRHEGVNLELIDALFEHLPPQDLLARLDAAPNGAHIRRACHLWEWLTERELPAGASPAGGYVELFPADDYVTAAQPTKDRRFRVRNNALGTADFSPVVLRAALPSSPSLAELLDKARETLASLMDPSLHEQAKCPETTKPTALVGFCLLAIRLLRLFARCRNCAKSMILWGDIPGSNR